MVGDASDSSVRTDRRAPSSVTLERLQWLIGNTQQFIIAADTKVSIILAADVLVLTSVLRSGLRFESWLEACSIAPSLFFLLCSVGASVSALVPRVKGLSPSSDDERGGDEARPVEVEIHRLAAPYTYATPEREPFDRLSTLCLQDWQAEVENQLRELSWILDEKMKWAKSATYTAGSAIVCTILHYGVSHV